MQALTFILSIQASIFSCSTAFLAWEMLVVLLLDMTSFILLPLKHQRERAGSFAFANGRQRCFDSLPSSTIYTSLPSQGPPGSEPSWDKKGMFYRSDGNDMMLLFGKTFSHCSSYCTTPTSISNTLTSAYWGRGGAI